MTTARQIKANRANARSSTGPRTDQGKARASRSALRHGLSVPVLSNPSLSKQVEDLALKILGGNANRVLLELARAIAEAQIDLDRIRDARREVTALTLNGKVGQLALLDRYERRARSRRKSATRAFDAARVECMLDCEGTN
jgi:hypothetical protein